MSGRDRVPDLSLRPDVWLPQETAPEVVRIAAVGNDGIWIAGRAPGQPPGRLRRARTIVDIGPDDVGAEMLVVHEGNDASLPVIVGRLRDSPGNRPTGVSLDADGRRLTVTAEERLTLQCGEASITLTRSGKILMSGHYVQSRSTGVNAIKGGSIELN